MAVAASFATLGIATETGVSTRAPAANTFLVGLVPTRGLVSRAGVIPISFTQDRVGVHATSVRDAALLLSAIAGFDPEDLSTTATLAAAGARSSVEDPGADVRGVRIGVLRELFRHGKEFAAANTLIDLALGQFGDQAALVDGLTTGLDLIARIPTSRVNNYELRFAFDAYLQRRGPASPVSSLADLVATGKYLKALGSRYDVAMKVKSLDDDEEYLSRLRQQPVVRDALITLMDRERVDVLAYPVKSVPAAAIGQTDKELGDNPISSIAGLPAIVLPVGLTPDGLPIALELLGRPFAEATVLRLGAAYERLRGPRVLPPTTSTLPGEVFEY